MIIPNFAVTTPCAPSNIVKVPKGMDGFATMTSIRLKIFGINIAGVVMKCPFRPAADNKPEEKIITKSGRHRLLFHALSGFNRSWQTIAGESYQPPSPHHRRFFGVGRSQGQPHFFWGAASWPQNLIFTFLLFYFLPDLTNSVPRT